MEEGETQGLAGLRQAHGTPKAPQQRGLRLQQTIPGATNGAGELLQKITSVPGSVLRGGPCLVLAPLQLHAALTGHSMIMTSKGGLGKLPTDIGFSEGRVT